MEYPGATQRPGPAWKVWPTANAIAGVILHSMEGAEAGAWSVLDGPLQASWHFSVMRDGRVFQHYPLDASPWHAGSRAQNVRLVGIEHEGQAGEPLTDGGFHHTVLSEFRTRLLDHGADPNAPQD